MVRNSSQQSMVPPDINGSAWLDYFETLLFKDNQRSIHEIDMNLFPAAQEADDILNSLFSDEEIRQPVLKLKIGKSKCEDGIGTEFYRHTCDIIVPVFSRLFNEILSSGEFPDSWSQSVIVPIHKSGSRNDPSRGI